MVATQKFRPVLTISQLTRISDLVSQSDNPTDLGIKKVIVPLLAKIDVGAISPSYIVTPESEQKKIDSDLRSKYYNGLMSPEEEADYEIKILGI